MPKFSVIIPHYNSYLLLEKCLNSIPQDNDIQIIVADDNSPDKEKIKELSNKFSYVQFIILSKNKGAGGARNEALKYAKGKWIIFADADDYFTDNAFKTFSANFESNADIIFFKACSINLQTGLPSNRNQAINQYINNFQKNQTTLNEDYIRFRTYVPWGKMIRKDLLSNYKILFDEIPYSNDLLFTTKIGYHAQRIAIDTDIVYCITESTGSLTRKINKNSILCRYDAAIRYNLFLKKIGKAQCQTILLRHFISAFHCGLPCIAAMLKLNIKYKANLFAGWRRWFEIIKKEKRQFSHY